MKIDHFHILTSHKLLKNIHKLYKLSIKKQNLSLAFKIQKFLLEICIMQPNMTSFKVESMSSQTLSQLENELQKELQNLLKTSSLSSLSNNK